MQIMCQALISFDISPLPDFAFKIQNTSIATITITDKNYINNTPLPYFLTADIRKGTESTDIWG